MRLTERHINYLTSLEKLGHTSAEAILLDAKRVESPLHELYDWDPASAAEAHWLERTRQIIRLVKVIVITENHTLRLPKYLRDPMMIGKEGGGYITFDTLKETESLARRALVNELERVTSALRRARIVAMALGLEDDVDQLLETVSGLRVANTVEDTESETPAATAPPPA
jgi:hypothetical protein